MNLSPTETRPETALCDCTVREFETLWEGCGGLVSLNFFARLAGLSHQRLYQLEAAGRLQIFRLFGIPLVGRRQAMHWLRSERKPGRPRKQQGKPRKPKRGRAGFRSRSTRATAP